MTHIEKPELLSPEIIARATKLSSTLLADAMGRNAGMDSRIKPVNDNMKIVGTAFTVSMRPADNLFLHKAIHEGAEGYVIVADGKGQTSHAYLGELMARTAKALGLEGIVIDGATRDREELEDIGFPIYSNGFVPNGPDKDGPGELLTPISCGGIHVTPGDLVVGDADGVTIIPKDHIDGVLKSAEGKLKEEETTIAKITEFEEKRESGEDVPRNFLTPSWLDEKMKRHGY